MAGNVANDVNLRWLESAGAGSVGMPDRHDVLNSLTAIYTAASLLDERWDELTLDQRRELAATVHRRAGQLRAVFARSAD